MVDVEVPVRTSGSAPQQQLDRQCTLGEILVGLFSLKSSDVLRPAVISSRQLHFMPGIDSILGQESDLHGFRNIHVRVGC